MIYDLKKLTVYILIIFSILYLIANIVFHNNIAPYVSFLLSILTILLICTFIIKRLRYLNYILEETKKIVDEDLENRIDVKGNGSFSKLALVINDISSLSMELLYDSIKNEVVNYKFIKEIEINNNLEIDELRTRISRIKNEVIVDIQSINLTELVDDLASYYEGDFINNNLELKKLYTNTPINVMGSKFLLREALSEIFKNIYQHSMENTKIYIDIKDEDNNIYLYIKNISKEEINIDTIRNNELGGIRLFENLLVLQEIKTNVETEAGLFKVTVIFHKKEIS
ncbi:MAG: hypothetical protein ACRC92_13990 [Peptostreptococcaceae bacterium]